MYALVLGELVDEIARTEGRDRATALLQAVGRRAASGVGPEADRETRVIAAAAALRGLGGDVDVLPTEGGWRLQGYSCPLSAVTANRPEVCALARALVEQITGEPVTECCERGDRPRCGFLVGHEGAHDSAPFLSVSDPPRRPPGPAWGRKT